MAESAAETLLTCPAAIDGAAGRVGRVRRAAAAAERRVDCSRAQRVHTFAADVLAPALQQRQQPQQQSGEWTGQGAQPPPPGGEWGAEDQTAGAYGGQQAPLGAPAQSPQSPPPQVRPPPCTPY